MSTHPPLGSTFPELPVTECDTMKTILLSTVDEVSGQGPLGVNHVEPAEEVVQLDDINI